MDQKMKIVLLLQLNHKLNNDNHHLLINDMKIFDFYHNLNDNLMFEEFDIILLIVHFLHFQFDEDLN
jgi:DNA-binding MltR family transcriptional regulator